MPVSQKANSDAAQLNKAGVKKVTAQPQAISEKTWEAVKLACVGGMGFSECARRFGINNVHTIIMKARRNHWPIPSRIQERARALQQGREKANTLARKMAAERNSNGEQTLEVVAESWAQKGERHRRLTFDLANSSLRAAAKKGLPIRNWRDADLADKSARRNAGLDERESHNINIGLALIDARLEASYLTLPKDGLPGGDPPPSEYGLPKQLPAPTSQASLP